jgi:predicted nuclease of predicted toxin-antitoxin system
MRILLDECVHAGLSKSLLPHAVTTVQAVGWRGIKNGSLLRLAATEYDVFITSDKNLEYQQHERALPLPVITLATSGNMWIDIEPIIPELIALISHPLNRAFYRIGA